MAKYLQLQKLKTDLSGTSTIIINQENIVLANELEMQNKVTQAIETVRRIVLIGHQTYTFYTRTTLDDLQTQLKTVDFTGGAGTGSSCTVPGVLDIVNVSVNFPTVKLLRVKNNTLQTAIAHIVNLNFLSFAEAVPFIDEETNAQVSAFMLTINSTPQERFLAKVTLAELQAVLDPTII